MAIVSAVELEIMGISMPESAGRSRWRDSDDLLPIMHAEVDYRRLLEKAHDAVMEIRTFLSVIGSAPQSGPSLVAKSADLSESIGQLESELDTLWDQFKRMRQG